MNMILFLIIIPIISIVLISGIMTFLEDKKFFMIYPFLISPFLGIVLSEIYFDKSLSIIIFIVLIIIHLIYYFNSAFRNNPTYTWHEHETKSGEPDLRYKNNYYHEHKDKIYTENELNEYRKASKMSIYSVSVYSLLILLSIFKSCNDIIK